MFLEDCPRQVFKKGAQVGITEVNVLKTLYGHLSGKYPQGVLYLFPTQNEVSDFSRARFGPLMELNQMWFEGVSTDAVSIKRIRSSMLYFRGARSTTRIEGIKRSSSQLKSIPVDRIVFDEMDEMDQPMIDLALERLGHSTVKEEIYVSTPTIPDYGIDVLYEQSDQRVWMIPCPKCRTETCLELDFPNCLQETSTGKFLRVCRHCHEEIQPSNGRWVPRYSDRSVVGWWISQLNSPFVDPATILQAYQNPPRGNLAEVYNSKLGMAYIAAENRLAMEEVLKCCRIDPMAIQSKGPCCMGVDVGQRDFHVLVGLKPADPQVLQILYLARVESFNDIHDIARRFNVSMGVFDMEPETRAVKDFMAQETYPIYLCDYVEQTYPGDKWDEEHRIVKIRRTEACDSTHRLVTSPGSLILPRRSSEVEEFARHCSNLAKVLQEDPETGSQEFRYRKLGPDHYRHALNYLFLAAQRTGIAYHAQAPREEEHYQSQFNIFAPDYGYKKPVWERGEQASSDWRPF